MTSQRCSVGEGDRPVLGSITGDADTFLRCTFGRASWRARPNAPVEVFDLDDFDRIVSSAIRVPAIRMIRQGERIPPSEFCTPTRLGSTTVNDVADVRKVLDLVRGGASVVLQSLHRTWSPVSAWCAALERELGWPVQANAYLTPPGERGLSPHADGHDVLAIQVHGSKNWHVDGLGSFVLCDGDVLYVPAGCEHMASTKASASLHLTVGIHRPSGERVARRAASLAIERAHSITGQAPGPSIRTLRDTLAGLDADTVVDGLRKRPRTHDAGLLATSMSRPATTATTRIVATAPWSVERVGERVTITWPGGRLHLPTIAQAALERLNEGTPVAVDELPGLDLDSGIVLARRLLDEGAVAPALECDG